VARGWCARVNAPSSQEALFAVAASERASVGRRRCDAMLLSAEAAVSALQGAGQGAFSARCVLFALTFARPSASCKHGGARAAHHRRPARAHPERGSERADSAPRHRCAARVRLHAPRRPMHVCPAGVVCFPLSAFSHALDALHRSRTDWAVRARLCLRHTLFSGLNHRRRRRHVACVARQGG
jgi:hypothetical protein